METTGISAVSVASDAAEVLRVAYGLLSRTTSRGTLPLLAPALGLGAALLVAAGGNVDALDGAALALACALGARELARGHGLHTLDDALDTWRRRHDDRAPTHDEALSFIVHALALL